MSDETYESLKDHFEEEKEVDKEPAEDCEGYPYVIVRSKDAGAFAGYLKNRDDGEVTLLKSRRLWYWDGAASLSQLSVDGVSKPKNCKFPCEIKGEHEIIGVCEIIPCTRKAQKSINKVKIWRS